MNIIYRISDLGYSKIKPDYINNENCLRNASSVFKDANWLVMADSVCDDTLQMIQKYQQNIKQINLRSNAGSFNAALDEALKIIQDDEIIYFCENDYIHREGSLMAATDAIALGADYFTLFDHPDKYISPENGGNPYCHGGAENTRLYRGNICHWKITNSTTMTFGSKVSTLKKDEEIIRKWTSGSHPHDFQMFLELGENKRTVISPIPSFSTHGETAWLSPFIDWGKVSQLCFQ